MSSEANIIIKSDADIEKMREVGKLAGEILDEIGQAVRPGTTTGDLERRCRRLLAERGVKSATLNYAPDGHPPFPAALCASVNHQVCHGVPSRERVLRGGDILNVDLTVIRDGYHGDTSRMFFVGKPSAPALRLCLAARECLWRGIRAAKPGAPLGDIGRAIESFAASRRFSVVHEYCGHGIGKKFHEAPQVVHFAKRGKSPILRPGMIFTIEPMINIGKRHTRVLADGWTVVTSDRSLSAQWEHTILITQTGSEALTLAPNETPPEFSPDNQP